MSEVGTRDARIREQLGAWWAEEFPAMVMPTEALIRLSERLAALSPVSRIRATGSIDDGRDRRLPDPWAVLRRIRARVGDETYRRITEEDPPIPNPTPSAEEEARGLSLKREDIVRAWEWVERAEGIEVMREQSCSRDDDLGAGREKRRLVREIATALTKRKADEETVAGWWREAQDHISELIDLLGRASEVAGGYADDFADLPERIATALTKRDALNIEALTTAHAEIARLAGEIAKRDAEIAEYAAHEEQTHRILGGILGTDDSLERCAKRMRERAEAAEAQRDDYHRKGESLCSWIGVLLTSLHVSTPEDGVAAVDALRRVVEAAWKVVDHPEHKGGAWIGLLRDQLAALDPQP